MRSGNKRRWLLSRGTLVPMDALDREMRPRQAQAGECRPAAVYRQIGDRFAVDQGLDRRLTPYHRPFDILSLQTVIRRS